MILLLELKASELKAAVMARMGGILFRNDDFILLNDAKHKNDCD
jgi:hypothetical protein